MKLFKNTQNRPPRRCLPGFTLAEMVITVGVFLFIFTGAMIAVQIFGLRVYTLAATKLVATAGSRKAMNQIRLQIQQAKTVYVGNCSVTGPTSFSLILSNYQQGNALIVYPTTNMASYTIFYLEFSTQTNSTNYLKQYNVLNGVPTLTNTLASFLTNQIVFAAADYYGNIWTSTNYSGLSNRLVIWVTMQFSQWEYPVGYVGGVGVNAFDYYQLRTRVYRRAWN